MSTPGQDTRYWRAPPAKMGYTRLTISVISGNTCQDQPEKRKYIHHLLDKAQASQLYIHHAKPQPSKVAIISKFIHQAPIIQPFLFGIFGDVNPPVTPKRLAYASENASMDQNAQVTPLFNGPECPGNSAAWTKMPRKLRSQCSQRSKIPGRKCSSIILSWFQVIQPAFSI